MPKATKSFEATQLLCVPRSPYEPYQKPVCIIREVGERFAKIKEKTRSEKKKKKEEDDDYDDGKSGRKLLLRGTMASEQEAG
uniref:Uncharacterized protein n=1 Tax=Trichogramma kaykai TaxID=54128 RepID=A0ABD2VYH7_9HYME